MLQRLLHLMHLLHAGGTLSGRCHRPFDASAAPRLGGSQYLHLANFAAGPRSNPGLNRIERPFFLCFREVAY